MARRRALREGTRVVKLGEHERPAVMDLTYLGSHGWPGCWLVNRINVPLPHRGKGIASKMFRDLCADADAAEVTLILEIQPSDGLTYDQLASWYMRLGFKYSDSYLGIAGRTAWIREPKKGGSA